MRQAGSRTPCLPFFWESEYMSSMRILIVEDDSEAAITWPRRFARPGMSPITSATGSKATPARARRITTSSSSTACCPSSTGFRLIGGLRGAKNRDAGADSSRRWGRSTIASRACAPAATIIWRSLTLLRTPRANRGSGAAQAEWAGEETVYRVHALELDRLAISSPATARRSSCSRASSGCSNI